MENLAAKRFAALLLDFGFFLLAFTLLSPILSAGMEALLDAINPQRTIDDMGWVGLLVAFIIFVGSPLAYFFVMGALTKASPGKILLGLKVYANNQPITSGRAGIRECVRLMEVYSVALAALSFYNITKGQPSTTEQITRTHVLRRDALES